VKGRRGAALLEAITALAVAGTGGVALAAVVAHSDMVLRRTIAREREVESAARVLTALSLLERHELEQRLGTSMIGEFRSSIGKPSSDLFRIGIAHDSAADRELLATLVYRSAPGMAGQ
jgi:hypothetical protein